MKPRVKSFAPQFLVDDLDRSMTYYRKLGFAFGGPWGVPYDVVTELASRGLIAVKGSAQTEVVFYRQAVDDYVESFHSRNGFSRARLTAGRAQEFDDKVRALLGRSCPDGIVWLPVQARITWCRPRASAESSRATGRTRSGRTNKEAPHGDSGATDE